MPLRHFTGGAESDSMGAAVPKAGVGPWSPLEAMGDRTAPEPDKWPADLLNRNPGRCACGAVATQYRGPLEYRAPFVGHPNVCERCGG